MSILRLARVMLAVVVCAIGVGPPAAAAPVAGEGFAGEFVARSVPPPDCTSPYGICTSGTLFDGESGRAVATYDFTVTDAWPDPLDPGTMRFKGKSVIAKLAGAPGRLFGNDEGHFTVSADGRFPFQTRVNVHGGEGTYVNATGLIVADGVIDMGTGEARGTYSGVVGRQKG